MSTKKSIGEMQYTPMTSHRTEYGYVHELGGHEIWAESPAMLARVIQGPLAHTGRLAILVVCADALQAVVDKREIAGEPAKLPERIYVEPATCYKLVVRETCRSV